MSKLNQWAWKDYDRELANNNMPESVMDYLRGQAGGRIEGALWMLKQAKILAEHDGWRLVELLESLTEDTKNE